MFEYVTLTVDWDRLQDVLNTRGAEGWHVVNLDRYVDGWRQEYRVVLERQTKRVSITQ